MPIQWYPGHMAKATREMIEKMQQIDVVIELVDARIPESSRNPVVDEIAGQKPRLVILNKSDLADAKRTSAWQDYFEKKGFSSIVVNSQTGSGTDKLAASVSQLTYERRKRLMDKGVNPRADRALILGTPNVGKSTLINRLANKRIAKIGDRPGITKTQQWIKVGNRLQLLDTPGILWPKFEEQIVGLRLAAAGAIKDEVIDYEEIATYLLRYLVQNYPDALAARYGLVENLATLDLMELYDKIGKKRGCLMSGGLVDYDKTAEIIVRDFRSQKLGRVTLENPDDYQH